VGGIGVTNIMLVTVTERTREIGIRKAIGARRRAILQQFLIESMILTGVGGVLGILLGIGLSVAAGIVLPQLVTDFPAPSVSVGSVVLAFTVSLLIGLVAGGYPANRAARMRPIDALRHQ
jgi:putative ABC transport system permease protein